MDIEEKEKLKGGSSERGEPIKPSAILCDTVWLTLTTAILLGVYIVTYLSNDSRFGVQNTTGEVSDFYYTQITPAGFTFIIWTFIYIWQALWVLYAWTFLCRPWMPRTIFTGVYIGYALVNASDIIWLYVWGNFYLIVACVILFFFQIFFYPTLAMLVGYFYKIHSEPHKVDVILTWILPINGLFFYATWTTIASLVNLAAALQYSATNLSEATSGTISLSLLLVTLVVYFILENAVLYRHLRYVVSVYPVVIWALIGVLANHWGVEGEERNTTFDLALLVVTISIFITRIVIIVVFSIIRPLHKYKSQHHV